MVTFPPREIWTYFVKWSIVNLDVGIESERTDLDEGTRR